MNVASGPALVPYDSYIANFIFFCYRAHTHLHSFPTRRSSDLDFPGRLARILNMTCLDDMVLPQLAIDRSALREHHIVRSEEHTSELQSHSDLVCRLLLEKKNHCPASAREMSKRSSRIA